VDILSVCTYVSSFCCCRAHSHTLPSLPVACVVGTRNRIRRPLELLLHPRLSTSSRCPHSISRSSYNPSRSRPGGLRWSVPLINRDPVPPLLTLGVLPSRPSACSLQRPPDLDYHLPSPRYHLTEQGRHRLVSWSVHAVPPPFWLDSLSYD
jgi:hypothetical protein